MNEMTKETQLLRNLKDAGCDKATIAKYIQLQKEGRQQEQYKLLSMHRALLLDQIHVSQCANKAEYSCGMILPRKLRPSAGFIASAGMR